MVLLIERPKTDTAGTGTQIAIPRNALTRPARWQLAGLLVAAEIVAGRLFRKVNRDSRFEPSRLSSDAVRQILLKRAAWAELTGSLSKPISPHGMRAGFVTTAYRTGVPDEEIMGHTRHSSLTTMRSYVRRGKLGQGSPARKVGL